MEDLKNLPSLVCENCYEIIKASYKFSLVCQQSDISLRECYNKTLTETKVKMESNEDITDEFTPLDSPLPDETSEINTFPDESVESFNDNKLETSKKKLKIDNVSKNQKVSTLSERLKEAQAKLAEDILRSNNMMLESPKTDDSLKAQKKKTFYNCPDPSLKFSSAEVLKLHHSTHKQSKKFNKMLMFHCKKCSKLFNDTEKLKHHCEEIHGEPEPKNDESNCKVEDKVVLSSAKKFFCLHCIPCKLFREREELITHLNENHGLKTVSKQGESAETNFNSETVSKSIDTHNGIPQTSEFKLLCKNCSPPKEFTTANEFVNHMCKNHNIFALEKLYAKKIEEPKNISEGSLKCSVCLLTFNNKKSLVQHLRKKHKLFGEMKCPEPDCGSTFYNNRQLIQHGIKQHQKYFAYFHKSFAKNFLQPCSEEDNKEKDFECDFCKKKYICKNSLKRHIIKAHLGKRESESVVCSYCGKSIASKMNLKAHIEFVHEAVFVTCPICEKNINYKSVGKHYKTHQPNTELNDSNKRFWCDLCGKILKSKRTFQDHKNLHKNIRDHLCDICGSGFTSKKFLFSHKKTHEEGYERKIYNCNQCDKVFTGRHTLNRHLLIHLGEKNFICEICSKNFYTLQELSRHVRYHKQDYKFDCQLCDKRFIDKSRFRHHMMKHKNIRPHKCHFCDKMFIHRGKMINHMAARHNVQVQNTKSKWKDPKTYISLDELL